MSRRRKCGHLSAYGETVFVLEQLCGVACLCQVCPTRIGGTLTKSGGTRLQC